MASRRAREPWSRPPSPSQRTQAPSLVAPFGLPALPVPGLKLGWVSAIGMARSHPQLRAGCAGRKPQQSDAREGEGAGEAGGPPPPPPEWFPGSSPPPPPLPPPHPRTGGGRRGWPGRGSPPSTLVPTMPCLKQRPGWLRPPPRGGGLGGTHTSTGGLGGSACGPTANSSGPGQVWARKGPGLRRPDSVEPSRGPPESPGPEHICVGAQTRQGAADECASRKFLQQVLVAPLVEN